MKQRVEKESVKKAAKPVKSDKPTKAIKKDDKEVVRRPKLAKRFNKLAIKKDDLRTKGIVYIGHLPRGFEESELRKFFEQFGNISKLRVARSKSTARSKGYAFLEFESKAVAEIAVKTMDGYMMFGKKVQCHLVDTPHKDTFKHANREWNFVPNQLIFRNKMNMVKTDTQKAERVKGLLEKEKEKRIRLKELGMDYEFPGYTALVEPKLKTKAAAPKKAEAKVTPKKEAKAVTPKKVETSERPSRKSSSSAKDAKDSKSKPKKK